MDLSQPSGRVSGETDFSLRGKREYICIFRVFSRWRAREAPAVKKYKSFSHDESIVDSNRSTRTKVPREKGNTNEDGGVGGGGEEGYMSLRRLCTFRRRGARALFAREREKRTTPRPTDKTLIGRKPPSRQRDDHGARIVHRFHAPTT